MQPNLEHVFHVCWDRSQLDLLADSKVERRHPGHQLDDVLAHVRRHLPQWEIKMEEVRRRREACLKEISRISQELVSALEKDLAQIESRIEELANSVGKILDEFQRVLSIPRVNRVKS